jgi:hypothetical protein
LTGSQYRAVASNGVAPAATSNAATLTVTIGAPLITTQPTNQTVPSGQNASFTVAAVGNAPLAYQWQISTGGGPFTSLSNTAPYSGVNTTTLLITGVTAGLDGAQYRAVVTNGLGSATSNAATLTVSVVPGFTTQPINSTVAVGASLSFTIVATGSPAPTLQWQVSTNGGSTFTNLANDSTYSGVTSATLTLTNVPAQLNGNQYRCLATNSGGTATSNVATLTVNTPPTIVTQPIDQTKAVGLNASFTVAASGSPSPTLRWQVSTGGPFADLTNSPPYSGVTTATLTVIGVTAGLSGNQYRAVATNSAGAATSDPAMLTVIVPPTITIQPTDQEVISGQTVSFAVGASGTPTPIYQWQASANFGQTWTNLTSSSATTATLTLTTADWWNNVEFRCVVTNAGGSATSAAAVLTVDGTMTVSPASWTFSASVSSIATLQRTFTVGFTGAPNGWTATANQAWLQVTNGSGNGAGQFTVRILNPGSVSGTLSGSITVTADASSNWPVEVPVTWTILSPLNAPIGSFDTPASSTTGVQGSIALSGWALAPVATDAIARVEIWRDVVAGDLAAPYQGAGPGNGKIFVANAPLVGGARPDIEAQFAGDPQAANAGWGALVFTRGLSSAGDGSYTLYAIAYDTAGRSAILGTTTITVDNAHATEPFGTIDTPSEGATVSGTISIAGWVLTPGATCTISSSGVSASIDSGPLVSVLYGQARPDIATAFPGFTNSDNAGGALALDTATLTNGNHQIAWSVTDSCGRQAWIGTRFLTVFNGSGATIAATGSSTIAAPQTSTPSNWDPVAVLQGQAGSWSLAYPNADGIRVAEIGEGNQLEVQLPPLGGATYAGYQRAGGTWRPLPLGSSLAGQVFSWTPAAGFLGSYDLAFVATASDGTQQLVRVRVVVGPSVRLWIEAPSAGANVAQPFELTGWAVDLAAQDGAGIDTVQVQAAPAAGGQIALGTAVTGEASPVVATIYGAQFMNSGFRLTVTGLAPGTYDLIVSAYTTSSGPLRGTKTIQVTVH